MGKEISPLAGHYWASVQSRVLTARARAATAAVRRASGRRE